MLVERAAPGCTERFPRGARGGTPYCRAHASTSTGGSGPEFCRNGHEQTEENRYTAPDGRTQCRACRREAHLRREGSSRN
jgi:hypothetical protein